MSRFNHRRLDRRVNRIQDRLPNRFAGWLGWLRTPDARWVRIPTSILMIIGGCLSFLPILGIWMLPLGLVLMAYDVPFLAGPTGRGLVKAEWRWREWKRRRRGSDTEQDATQFAADDARNLSGTNSQDKDRTGPPPHQR